MHFEESMKKIKNKVNQYMLQFYQNWIEKARQQLPKTTVKPSTYV